MGARSTVFMAQSHKTVTDYAVELQRNLQK